MESGDEKSQRNERFLLRDDYAPSFIDPLRYPSRSMVT